MPINSFPDTDLYSQIMQPDSHQENTQLISEFVAQLINDAIRQQASDIHFEPQQETMRIRFRIDGLLHQICQIHPDHSPGIISHLKVRANLDIAEKRLPQDGSCQIQPDKSGLNARISTLPTLFGEKAVLRLLCNNAKPLSIQELGLESDQQQQLIEAIKKPQGLILVTGPTGSGKTTTLYTLLSTLNDSSRNISCVEDPVEIILKGANQLSIHPDIGLDFHAVLKALLRQDPDIIVVGEIRELKTAKMVIQATQSGHLVLSSLHTNNAIEAFNRLGFMGLPQQELLESIILVIAQRLVRKRCQYCNGANTRRAKDCKHCVKGYRGQTGIYECLTIDKSKDINTQRYRSLKACAQLKVKQGITSTSEIQRVLG